MLQKKEGKCKPKVCTYDLPFPYYSQWLRHAIRLNTFSSYSNIYAWWIVKHYVNGALVVDNQGFYLPQSLVFLGEKWGLKVH